MAIGEMGLHRSPLLAAHRDGFSKLGRALLFYQRLYFLGVCNMGGTANVAKSAASRIGHVYRAL